MRKRAWIVAAGIIAGLVSWDQYLFPPISYYLEHTSKGLFGTAVELLIPRNEIYHDGWGIGYIFLFTTLVLGFTLLVASVKALRSLVNYVNASEVDISVLRMDVTVYAVDTEFKRVRISRTQVFHANKSSTSAFYAEHQADAPKGKVDRRTLHAESFLNGRRITKLPHVTRSTPKSIEVIERFDADLRISFLLTYFPNSWVLWLRRRGMYKRHIVTREASVEYENEYNEDEPIFQLAATRYPVTNIRIRLNFPTETAPDAAEFSAFRIRQNAVEELDLARTSTHDRCQYEVVVKQLKNAVIRIEWKNTVLRKWQEAQAAAAKGGPAAPLLLESQALAGLLPSATTTSVPPIAE